MNHSMDEADAVAQAILRQAASPDSQTEKVIVSTVFNGPVSVAGDLTIGDA